MRLDSFEQHEYGGDDIVSAPGRTLRRTKPRERPSGSKFFQGKTLHIDFGTLSLEATDAPIPATLKQNHLTFSPAGLMVLQVGLAEADQPAVWDTGAGLTSVDQAFAQAHSDIFTYVQDITGGYDANGKPVKLSLYTLKQLKIAGKVFIGLSVLGFDFTPIRNGRCWKLKFDIGIQRHCPSELVY